MMILPSESSGISILTAARSALELLLLVKKLKIDFFGFSSLRDILLTLLVSSSSLLLSSSLSSVPMELVLCKIP
jgi:hypothetical protein